jgi:hypothetical protein
MLKHYGEDFEGMRERAVLRAREREGERHMLAVGDLGLSAHSPSRLDPVAPGAVAGILEHGFAPYFPAPLSPEQRRCTWQLSADSARVSHTTGSHAPGRHGLTSKGHLRIDGVDRAAAANGAAHPSRSGAAPPLDEPDEEEQEFIWNRRESPWSRQRKLEAEAACMHENLRLWELELQKAAHCSPASPSDAAEPRGGDLLSSGPSGAPEWCRGAGDHVYGDGAAAGDGWEEGLDARTGKTFFVHRKLKRWSWQADARSRGGGCGAGRRREIETGTEAQEAADRIGDRADTHGGRWCAGYELAHSDFPPQCSGEYGVPRAGTALSCSPHSQRGRERAGGGAAAQATSTTGPKKVAKKRWWSKYADEVNK